MNNSFSKYRNINSIIHSIDPITKVIGFLIITIIIFIAQNIGLLIIVFLFTFLLSILSRVRAKTYFKLLFLIAPFFLITTIMYMIFLNSGKIFIIKIIGQMSLRFYTLLLLSIILTNTTREIDITSGIEFLIYPLKFLKIPIHEISLMMMLAIRFVPLLLEDFYKVMIAQTSRGVNVINGNFLTKIKGIKNSLLPMLFVAFKRSDDMSKAMVIRGYKIGSKRTKYKKNKFGLLEFFFLFILVMLLILIIYLRFFIEWGLF